MEGDGTLLPAGPDLLNPLAHGTHGAHGRINHFRVLRVFRGQSLPRTYHLQRHESTIADLNRKAGKIGKSLDFFPVFPAFLFNFGLQQGTRTVPSIAF